MLEARNFKDRSVIENLSDAELEGLVGLDKEGQRHGRNTIVSLINDNFEGKGRRMFIAVPTKREGIEKLHYRGYLLDSWDEKPRPVECINSYFATKQDAEFMADALYGAEDIVDEAGRGYKARLEIQERQREEARAKRERTK